MRTTPGCSMCRQIWCHFWVWVSIIGLAGGLSIGCESDSANEGAEESRTLTVDAEGVRYRYLDETGQFQPTTKLQDVPLAVRRATEMWKSSSDWERPEGQTGDVADLLEAEPGDEVALKERSHGWMKSASVAGRKAARRALGLRDELRGTAKWADHEPWIWRVGSGQESLYVFGALELVTIDDVSELGPGFEAIFSSVDRVMLEVAERGMASADLRKLALRAEGEPTVEESLSEEALKTLTTRLGGRISLRRMNQFRPWLLVRELVADLKVTGRAGQMGGAAAENRRNGLIQRRIELAAKANDKEVGYLVSPGEVAEMEKEAIGYESLERVAEELEAVEGRFKRLKQAYEEGNIEAVREDLAEPGSGLQPGWPGFEARRKAFTDAVFERLFQTTEGGDAGKSEALVVVGVEEIVSEGGVLQRLRDAGMRVERLE